MQNKEKIILGIDPGYARLGLAIIKKDNSEKLIYSECFETTNKDSHPYRLFLISKKISSVIEKYKPNIVGVETLLFSKNTKTAMLVAEARGAILQKCAEFDIDIREYNPNEIKLAVTGYGKSDKKQIIDMVKKILGLKNEEKKLDDEYDAIAIALTCSTLLSTKNI